MCDIDPLQFDLRHTGKLLTKLQPPSVDEVNKLIRNMLTKFSVPFTVSLPTWLLDRDGANTSTERPNILLIKYLRHCCCSLICRLYSTVLIKKRSYLDLKLSLESPYMHCSGFARTWVTELNLFLLATVHRADATYDLGVWCSSRIHCCSHCTCHWSQMSLPVLHQSLTVRCRHSVVCITQARE